MENAKSRSDNSSLNMLVGLGSQSILLIFSFISRTVFVYYLGAEYLGLNGLYTNILMVLSLAELGIGNVMIFSLYKPLKDKDKNEIIGLINFYKSVYKKIAACIFVLGICLIPFLDKIVNSNFSYSETLMYYILFLINSVISYFVIHKSSLISADQRIYVISAYNAFFMIIRDVLQIILLINFRSFLIFLVVQISFTLLNSFFINKKANNMYPFLNDKTELIPIDTTIIKKNIKSMLIYKIGTVLMNNTDSILISILVGTIFVGYYSNYILIITAVTMFISILIQGISASIGNLNARGNIKKSYEFFNTILLFFHWLTAFVAIAMLTNMNDFITFWIGKEYLLSNNVVLAIVINFYIQNIINPVWIYRETMGLFQQIKYVMIIAAIINLCVSIVLGIEWGIVGIIIATSISRILTTVWYEPTLLYKLKFGKNVNIYWKKQGKYFLGSLISFLIIYFISPLLVNGIEGIILKVTFSFIIVSVIFVLISHRDRELYELLKYINFIRNKVKISYFSK